MELDHFENMRLAIDASKKTKFEDNRLHPKVGAVLVKGNKQVSSYRGEDGKGGHAEYCLLEKILRDDDLSGATLYVTLEPSNLENHNSTDLIIKRGISKVYIGLLNPNRNLCGFGFWQLRQKNIEVEFFPPELVKEIELENNEFVATHLFEEGINNKFGLPNPIDLPYIIPPEFRRLDDWYYIVNRIYFDKNYYLTPSEIIMHLVEILGGLSQLTTLKIKPNVIIETHLAKAIVWWFTLCGKMGIRSVEDFLYYKFPYCCPYCLKCPHNPDECDDYKAKNNNPNWDKLLELNDMHDGKRPSSLSEWQKMYNHIYPVQQTEQYSAVFGRFTEEIGELSEAIRAFQFNPTYFITEAADVFAWLMHLINLYESKNNVSIDDRGKRIEAELYFQYPDKCKNCNQVVCACPPVLKSTIGRIAKSSPLSQSFMNSKNPFLSKSDSAALFDLGSQEITIGISTIKVTAELIRSIYETSIIMIKAIRRNELIRLEKKEDVIDQLVVISNLALTQRVNQNPIYRFLREFLNLNTIEQREVEKIIISIPDGIWKKILVDYLEYLSLVYHQ